MTPSPEEMIRGAFELYGRDGMEALLPYVDPEIEVIAESVLNTANGRGHAAVLEFACQWEEAWAQSSYEVESIERRGAGLYRVDTRTHARGAGSGLILDELFFYVLELRDGRFTRLHLYGDPAAADEAVRELLDGEGGRDPDRDRAR
jgi:ketosteroid isomerase-like protein